MSNPSSGHPVVLNEDKRRFEANVDGSLAVAEFIKTKDKLILTHTEVPPALSGKGIASLLAKTALQYARSSGLRVMPLCPFMAGYMARHPEWESLLVPGINVA
ncbi:GNAT family N-acetyltransferase [Phaeodactylibacter luteus]|nr:GNAT family N-acetyltransferase [Phaeodactylibacter luteus]